MYRSHPERSIPPQQPGLTTVYASAGNPLQGWRVFTLYAGGKMIQVSQSLEARKNLGIKMALRSIRPLVAGALFLVILVLISVNCGLSSLIRVTAAVAARTPGSLEPIRVKRLPSEVVPLVDCINNLLERLRHAFDTQSRFIADAAHELRTPLAVIQLQAHNLKRTTLEEERSEAQSQLMAGVNRASHMVSQLLALARLELEWGQAAPETIALDELVAEVVEDQKGLAAEKGVVLALAAEPVIIVGGPDAVRVLVSNLVDNAVRYTPPAGAVTVAVRRQERCAVLEVCDTGPGILPCDRERVFERFHRLPGSANGGSGLGLSIVQSALDRLAGTITLADGTGGKGLRVTVSFPPSPQGNNERTQP